MAPTPIVSAEQVAAVADAYLDRMADLARRLDVPVPAVGEVIRRAGVATVDACAREPEAVADILGRWAANIRALATRVRSGTTTAMPAAGTAAGRVLDTGDAATVSTGREARATSAVLAGLDERTRFVLLLRDSYDAPQSAVAVALGIAEAEAATVVAEARLRLLEGSNGRPAPTLAGHETIAGISLGTLGAMADGSAPDADPEVRLRRRHVGGCQACAAILDAQNRARVVMSGLPVLALADEARQPALEAILERATATLLNADEVEVALDRQARVLPGAVIGLALAFALVLGVGVGAILRHSKASADQGPSPAPSGVILSSPTPTATASPSESPSASSSTAATSAPTFAQAFSPTAVPTSLKPSPSKSKSRKSATPRATRTATASGAPATTAPPVPVSPTAGPTSAAPTSAAPASSAPATSAPAAPPSTAVPTLGFPTPTATATP